MSLLELKERQEIIIDKEKYEILNRIKFIEKSSYWFEYKIRRLEDNKIYYLSVEVQSKAILYEMLENAKIEIKMNINFQGEEYELYEKGTATVETYYGMADVALKDKAIYYEYVSKKDNEKFLSIEKWKDETEISMGRKLSLSDIKY